MHSESEVDSRYLTVLKLGILGSILLIAYALKHMGYIVFDLYALLFFSITYLIYSITFQIEQKVRLESLVTSIIFHFTLSLISILGFSHLIHTLVHVFEKTYPDQKFLDQCKDNSAIVFFARLSKLEILENESFLTILFFVSVILEYTVIAFRYLYVDIVCKGQQKSQNELESSKILRVVLLGLSMTYFISRYIFSLFNFSTLSEYILILTATCCALLTAFNKTIRTYYRLKIHPLLRHTSVPTIAEFIVKALYYLLILSGLCYFVPLKYIFLTQVLEESLECLWLVIRYLLTQKETSSDTVISETNSTDKRKIYIAIKTLGLFAILLIVHLTEHVTEIIFQNSYFLLLKLILDTCISSHL
jgi:hypothetical protein